MKILSILVLAGFALLELLSGCCDDDPCVCPPALPDLEEGLVAYWDFNECSGTVVHDVSGNCNRGTNYGADWVLNDPLCGCALDIVQEEDGVWDIPATWDDGIGNYLTLATRVTWHGPTPEDPARGCGIFDSRGSDGALRYGMVCEIYPSGQIRFQLLRGTEAEHITIFSNFRMPIGCATYLAVVLNQPGGWLRLYVNGELDNSVAAEGGYIQSDLTAAIGNNHWAHWDTQWHQLHGVVDELRIYNRALDDGEILELSDQCGAPSATCQCTWGRVKALYR